MEVSNDQLVKISKLIGESELIKIIPNFLTEVFNENKIYIYGEYKLHRIDEKYAFIDLNSSNCYANSTSSAEEQIKFAGKKLKVFNSWDDYIKWRY